MDDFPRYQVIVSDRARQMLMQHILFLARKNTTSAHAIRKRVMEGIRGLSVLPERYPFFESDYITHNKYHRLFIENWYLVLYQIKGTNVYVDYILDCRQDYGWLLIPEIQEH